MVELNPDHPVTEQLHDNWHKFCGILMMKLGARVNIGEVFIGLEDVNKLAALGDGVAVLAHVQHDGIHLKLVDAAGAARAVRQSKQ